MGIVPQIVREVPACMKIHFDVGDMGTEDYLNFNELLASEEFRAMCRGVNVSQVQFGSTLLRAK